MKKRVKKSVQCGVESLSEEESEEKCPMWRREPEVKKRARSEEESPK